MIKKQQRGYSYWESKCGEEPTYNIIFVHSFACNSDYFKDFAEKFSEKKYDCYLLDLPGFGVLTPPSYKPMSLETMAEYVCDFIYNNDLRNVVLIGHSYGALVCEWVSHKLHRPNDRIIAKNILISPANLISFPNLWNIWHTDLTDADQLLSITKKLMFDKNRIDTSIESVLNECIHQEEIAANMKILRKHDLKWKTARWFFKLPLLLKDSTLIILGANDEFVVRKRTYKKFKKNPFCVIKEIDQCGHIPFIEKPEETFKMIDEYLYPTGSKIEF